MAGVLFVRTLMDGNRLAARTLAQARTGRSEGQSILLLSLHAGWDMGRTPRILILSEALLMQAPTVKMLLYSSSCVKA
jgi:hypothetical protein